MKFKYLLLAILSLLCAIPSTSVGAASPPEPLTLFMTDGQLISHPIRVFIQDRAISPAMKPELCLVRLPEEKPKPFDPLKYCLSETKYFPIDVASNQTYTDKHQMTGTILLFDLSDLAIPYYWTGIRMLPVLKWSEQADVSDADKNDPAQIVAIAPNETYLSSRIGTTIWTVTILSLLLIFSYSLTKSSDKGFLGLFATKEGYLSISLIQMALWTLGVGGMVLGFGFMRLEVPEIPETLVWLMGFSITTSVVGHWQSHVIQANLIKGKKGRVSQKPSLRDLVMVYAGDDSGEQFASLAKAQLLFWTVISLCLFVVKSIQTGELWGVPEQLVLLMGVSQSGYLARKQQAVLESKPKKTVTEEEKKKWDQTS